MSFKRALVTGDAADLDTPSDGDMFIVWAMGRLGADGRVTRHLANERTSGHSIKLFSCFSTADQLQA